MDMKLDDKGRYLFNTEGDREKFERVLSALILLNYKVPFRVDDRGGVCDLVLDSGRLWYYPEPSLGGIWVDVDKFLEFNETQKEEVDHRYDYIRLLNDIIDDRRSNTNGICTLLRRSLGGEHLSAIMTKENLKSWQLFSGQYDYPIPGGRDSYFGENKWEGIQGDLRVNLCEHLIKCLESEITNDMPWVPYPERKERGLNICSGWTSTYT